ncbi:TPA: F0F1 ATP synthase subunit delta [Legionella pneumophila]|jgi:F-type H+-transporting ATPase subunit b
MDLSWSTFLLELINFLVLIWILKHFLYVPIQKTILNRKKRVQEQLENAELLHKEAKQLQITYEHRLTDWQHEKEHLQKEFQQVMDQWKVEEMIHFKNDLKNEKERIVSQERQQLSTIIEKNSKEAFMLAGKFAEKLLKQLADQHLEEKIIELFIKNINALPVEKVHMVADASLENTVRIQSAYPINEPQQRHLLHAIEKLVKMKCQVEFVENQELLAGLTVQMDSVFLQANLRDELKFFTEI